MFKSRMMTRTGHVAPMAEKRIAHGKGIEK
jgi:hypothetical protein